ncbi:hypothetical protein JYG23_12520 [Sedimentibacter sp. zth1]|uniref:hypothetical protein n=1 Tax=Sedimentibacter sp. zth1 TaxID=2816908 RepID=UPI001A931F4B|nr:hypothetical protein [Sedimentibacter sp. zth1]QSX05491.1 hypothetical protein JYG23_12520 [Sedimentibacter sp. zth1]
MLNNLQNLFGNGDGLGGCDNLLLFFLLFVAISCFCCGDNNNGDNSLLNAFNGMSGGCDSLLFFFLLLIVLFCSNDTKGECGAN